ncbi:hypothetical protein ACSQ67_006515 [Phaseolus vulgaris]
MENSDQRQTIATAINHSTVRRRPTATSAGRLYNSPESTDSSGEDLVKDSGSDDFMDTVDSAVAYSQPPQKHETATSNLEFAYRPSVPAHRRVKESPLSSDSIFRQYGLLIKSGFWFSSSSLSDWPLFMCCLSLVVFPFTAFIVEKLAQWKCIPESVVVLLHIIITSASVLYPVLVILRCDSAFVSGVTLMLFSCVVWLKLVSYAHTNYDMRQLTKSIEKGEAVPNTVNMEYPYSVRFKSLAYFMVAPTLCYQFRHNVSVSVFLTCVREGDGVGFRLNILAELLRFGDREFYKDWWNAKTVEDPVHKWMIRHLYFPCLRHGIPKAVALLIAFLVSALFHELCIAVPCHIFKLWAFGGIMFQVPLVLITHYLQEKFRNSMVGNMIFWFIFSILGQPMCVLLYYHDLMNRKSKLDQS